MAVNGRQVTEKAPFGLLLTYDALQVEGVVVVVSVKDSGPLPHRVIDRCYGLSDQLG